MREWGWFLSLIVFYSLANFANFANYADFFYTVLKKLTRSFLGWEAMGLGIGSYEIVVRKLVGEMYRALTITVLTVFLEGVWKIRGAVSNLSNLSFFVTIAWKIRLQIVSIKIILYIIIYINIYNNI